MTDAVGMTHFGQAYVNPKSGAISQQYVPKSAYGALNAAIQDLVGSLYTYPGATAGLPSKGSIDRTIANNLLPNSSKDFQKVDNPNVSVQDQQFSQIAQQANSGGNLAPTTPGVASPPVAATSIPAQRQPSPTPRSARISTAKKKKADYTPYLLPGQSKLGQL
jgi:hypothetical protein